MPTATKAREPIGANTKIQLGAAAAVVLAMVAYATRMEGRITSLSETAISSEKWLQKIEEVGEKTNEELTNLRIVIERVDIREIADVRLLTAEINRLKERVDALEKDQK